MCQELKQSTAATVLIGPVIDDDGALYTTDDLAYSDLRLAKNGAVSTPNSSATVAHSHRGHFLVTLTASDTGTLGRLDISLNKSGADMVTARFMVVQTVNTGITTVTPLSSSVPQRLKNLEIETYVRDTGDVTITIADANGNVVDLTQYSDMTFRVADKSHTVLQSVTNIASTISGSSDEQVTWSPAAEVVRKVATHDWSLRKTSNDFVIAGGTVRVSYKP